MNWRQLVGLPPKSYTVSDAMIKATVEQVRANHRLAEMTLSKAVQEFIMLRNEVLEDRKRMENEIAARSRLPARKKRS